MLPVGTLAEAHTFDWEKKKTVDTLRPSCSRWELVGQRRPAQGQEKEATGTDLKQQDVQIAIQAHPELLNSVPPEHIIALLHCDKPEQQPFFHQQGSATPCTKTEFQ